MIYKRRVIIFSLLVLLVFGIVGCSSRKEVSKDRQLNIYVDIKDKESQNILKFIIDEYKNSNSKLKLNINNAMGGNIEEDIGKSNDTDIVITSRSKMLKLTRKGLLSDMGNYYDENTINDRYYRIINAYGRFDDKYYGIGLIPYSIEILYNKSAVNKLGLKSTIVMSDMKDILKKLSDTSNRVPVLLPEDLDINSGLSSIIFCNKISMRKLESKYDSGANSYKSLSEVQQGFDTISDLIKNGSINKNTFEIGNESSINRFLRGDIPIIISSSYYANNFKDSNINIVGDDINNLSSKLNVPVICNSIISVPVNSKNGEEISNFIKFALGDDIQKKLVQKGFISGDKKANISIKEVARVSIVKHLENSTEDSVIFAYNVPEKLSSSVSAKIEQMLSGKITKKEWEEAVDDVYR